MADSALSYPYDTVVRITDTIGAQSWQGSGVLISPDEVLTASHVLYSAGRRDRDEHHRSRRPMTSGSQPLWLGLRLRHSLFPGRRRQRPHQQRAVAVRLRVIHLSSSFASVGTMGIEANFAGGTVNVTGYPASAGGAQVTSTQTVTVDPYYTLARGNLDRRGLQRRPGLDRDRRRPGGRGPRLERRRRRNRLLRPDHDRRARPDRGVGR